MMKRRIGILLLAICLLGVGYGAAGLAVYQIGTAVNAACGRSILSASGASDPPDVDLSEYQLPALEFVSFPSREDALTIQASFVPAEKNHVSVILVHGLSGCRRAPAILLAAGMLHRAGFSVAWLAASKNTAIYWARGIGW
jgi:hypothetical protein